MIIDIENILTKVRDRFELVVLAATRAAEINRGATPTIRRNKKQKDVSIALNEIIDNTIDIRELRKSALHNQKYKGAQPYRRNAISKLRTKSGTSKDELLYVDH